MVEVVEFRREDVMAQNLAEDGGNGVAVVDDEQAERDAEGRAEDADGGALEHEDAGDRPAGDADGFQRADFTRLLDDDRDERRRDAEGGDEQDERHEKRHEFFLNLQRAEQHLVAFLPRDDFETTEAVRFVDVAVQLLHQFVHLHGIGNFSLYGSGCPPVISE